MLRFLAVVAVLGLLAACSSGSGSADAGGGLDGAQWERAAPEPGQVPDTDTDQRHVIVTGWMTLSVRNATTAADETVRIVEDAGGRVDARSQQTVSGSPAAEVFLRVRIPSDRLTETLRALEDVGEVQELSTDSEDVTLQVTDLDARIEALEVSIARLQGLMADATSTADLLAAESALSERQAELDSLRAQRTVLGEQVDLATIHITLRAPSATPAPVPGGFWGGVVQGWSSLVTAFNRTVVVLGVLLPWAVVGGIVAGIVLIVRRARPNRPDRPRRHPVTGPVPQYPARPSATTPQQGSPGVSHPGPPQPGAPQAPPPGQPPSGGPTG